MKKMINLFLSLGLIFSFSVFAKNLTPKEVFAKHEANLMSAIMCSPNATGGAFVGMISNCKKEWVEGLSGISLHTDKQCFKSAIKKLKKLSNNGDTNVVCEGEDVVVFALDGVLLHIMNIGVIRTH